ncbi:MAG: methionyl-tRNA formyltransferase [Candidatus Gastranaerophilales bacterium]|nr:methionyl-tRNA formyltransferase [Candidatus Gastranaerophilales bacterium]
MDKISFKKRILFIGVPDMGYIGLDTLLCAGVNIVGVMGPLKTHNTYFAFRNFVFSKKLNFIEYDNLKSPELLNYLKNLNIDLAVVCSFNNKIPMEFINSVKDGILNVHPSLLPLYRGGNPYSRVIMNNEKETGVTIHFMSENFDEGDIVFQEKCPVEPFETMGTIFEKTNKIGCRLLLKAIIEYEKSPALPKIKQPDGDFAIARNLTQNEQFIDYDKTAAEIERFVRALNPYITALTVFRNQIIRVHKVKYTNETAPLKCQNGEIFRISKDEIYIKTAKGTIIPEVIQYGGCFIGDAYDFIKIVKPETGEIFKNG